MAQWHIHALWSMHDHIDSLMKKWNKSSALALELHFFCIKQLILCVFSNVYIIPLHAIT